MVVIQAMEMGPEWHTVAIRGCAIASAILATRITLTLQGFTQIGSVTPALLPCQATMIFGSSLARPVLRLERGLQLVEMPIKEQAKQVASQGSDLPSLRSLAGIRASQPMQASLLS